MTLRVVDVKPPSVRDETLAVLQALAAVLVIAAVVVGVARRDTERGSTVQGFERRFGDLPAVDQRMFRALQEGALEAERVRAATGAWPDVAQLASEGVPPFTADPLDTGKYAWRMRHDGLLTTYEGIPANAERMAWLMHVLEPDPQVPEDPRAVVDETHHRIANGPLIHVTLWRAESCALPDTIIQNPVAAALVQVLASLP